MLQWMITGRCNYHCRHCYLGETREEEPDTERLLRMIPLIRKAGMKEVCLTGGEPLIRDDLETLVRALSENGIRILRLGTNGKALTEERLEMLARYGQRPEIGISYDGPGTHGYLRGREDAEEDAVRAMARCREKGFPFRAELTLYPGNLGSLRESVRVLSGMGCAGLKAVPCLPMGSAAETERRGAPMSLAPAEVLRAVCDYIPRYYEDGIPMELDLYAYFYARGAEGIWTIPAEWTAEPGADDSMCARDVTAPFLTADGRLLPCAGIAGIPEMKKEFPRVEESLAEAAQVPAFRRFTEYTVCRHQEANPACAGCPHAALCGGGCRMVPLSRGGGFTERDEYLCEYFLGGWGERVRAAVREGLRLRRKGVKT